MHASEDGKDGHVRIEFYGKPAANPLVRLSWTDEQGKHHKQERNLPALTGEMQPRLIQARVKAGEQGVERLTWMLPADFAKDDYDQWLRLEGQDQVDRNIFSVEQARGQLHWLELMHAAGIYRDEGGVFAPARNGVRVRSTSGARRHPGDSRAARVCNA